jgi:NAD(P)-dependent dehydrogenase (short-subunit alcohol dehydrogenase family)
LVELVGKSALITGGAGNLGLAIGRLLAAEGATIGLADLVEQDRLEAVASSLGVPDGSILAISADVSREEDCEQMVARTLAAFGKLDILVANAGIGGGTTRVWESSAETWRRTLEVNLTGAFLTAKHAVPSMIERRYGKIVFTSSRDGLRAEPYTGAYNASKHGLHGLMKTLAIELGPYEINVNAICPTSIGAMGQGLEAQRYWELMTGQAGATEADYDVWAGMQNLFERPHRVSAHDVAEAVLWLVSERSALVTGHAMPVDAGWIAKRGG